MKNRLIILIALFLNVHSIPGQDDSLNVSGNSIDKADSSHSLFIFHDKISAFLKQPIHLMQVKGNSEIDSLQQSVIDAKSVFRNLSLETQNNLKEVHEEICKKGEQMMQVVSEKAIALEAFAKKCLECGNEKFQIVKQEVQLRIQDLEGFVHHNIDLLDKKIQLLEKGFISLEKEVSDSMTLENFEMMLKEFEQKTGIVFAQARAIFDECRKTCNSKAKLSIEMVKKFNEALKNDWKKEVAEIMTLEHLETMLKKLEKETGVLFSEAQAIFSKYEGKFVSSAKLSVDMVKEFKQALENDWTNKVLPVLKKDLENVEQFFSHAGHMFMHTRFAQEFSIWFVAGLHNAKQLSDDVQQAGSAVFNIVERKARVAKFTASMIASSMEHGIEEVVRDDIKPAISKMENKVKGIANDIENVTKNIASNVAIDAKDFAEKSKYIASYVAKNVHDHLSLFGENVNDVLAHLKKNYSAYLASLDSYDDNVHLFKNENGEFYNPGLSPDLVSSYEVAGGHR